MVRTAGVAPEHIDARDDGSRLLEPRAVTNEQDRARSVVEQLLRHAPKRAGGERRQSTSPFLLGLLDPGRHLRQVGIRAWQLEHAREREPGASAAGQLEGELGRRARWLRAVVGDDEPLEHALGP
jgi:hypothetical protein